jgi:hypothetical protein
MEPLYTNNSLQFIKSNLMQNQIIYEYTDRLKLSDLERISKYEIFQDTIRNEYKNGGYQIKNLRENTNFILSPNPQLVYVTKKTKGYTSTDQTYFEIQTNADSILKNYNNCVYNGYSDWRLASAKEIESFVNNYVQNNFDNVMFKEFEFYFDMDDPELKLIYERPYQSGHKYHWARRSDDCKFLSSSMKNQLNEIGESREYNILCYFDQFIAHIKERDSDDFPKNPLQGQYFHKTNRITDVVLLFIVRSNNN